MEISTLIVAVAGAYLLAGILLAPVLAFYAVSSIDASAAQGSIGFQLIVLPGLAALWPVMLVKVWKARRSPAVLPVPEKPVSPRGLRSMHGVLTVMLAVSAPAIALMALIWKSPDFRDAPIASRPSSLTSASNSPGRATTAPHSSLPMEGN